MDAGLREFGVVHRGVWSDGRIVDPLPKRRDQMRFVLMEKPGTVAVKTKLTEDLTHVVLSYGTPLGELYTTGGWTDSYFNPDIVKTNRRLMFFSTPKTTFSPMPQRGDGLQRKMGLRWSGCLAGTKRRPAKMGMRRASRLRPLGQACVR
jgi:hypothetical protein